MFHVSDSFIVCILLTSFIVVVFCIGLLLFHLVYRLKVLLIFVFEKLFKNILFV